MRLGNASKRLRRQLPKSIIYFVWGIREHRRKLIYSGKTHYCPICQSYVRILLPVGNPPRQNALCPVCRPQERHRLDWIFLRTMTDLFDKSIKRLLHVAPEKFFIPRFIRIKNIHYTSADLIDAYAMLRLDLTNIPVCKDSYDVIYCSHVLEHIQNDVGAITELYRVLRPGGWALLQVPITAERTIEDPNIVSPEERERVFGQKDHVRRCGLDYIERIQAAGFMAEIVTAAEIINDDGFQKLGITKDRYIFYCKKLQEVA